MFSFFPFLYFSLGSKGRYIDRAARELAGNSAKGTRTVQYSTRRKSR